MDETVAASRLTLEDRVAGHLRGQILGGRLRPGDRVVTDTLARELGVSRLPVRQALQRLDGAGLVELRPHRGAIVAVPDEHPLPAMRELLQVRRRLEPWAASLAAQRRTDDDVRRLRTAVDAGRTAAEHGDARTASVHHHAVVQAVVAASHHDALGEAYEPLLNRTALLFAMLTGDGPEPAATGWEHHAEIVDAIDTGNARAAATATRRHLRHVDVELRRFRTPQ